MPGKITEPVEEEYTGHIVTVKDSKSVVKI